MKLSEIIIAYRNEHGLSQRQFAEKCGIITNGYLSMIENDANPATGKPVKPSVDKLYSIATAMNMTLDELFAKADNLSVYMGSRKSSKSDSTPEIQELNLILQNHKRTLKWFMGLSIDGKRLSETEAETMYDALEFAVSTIKRNRNRG